MDTSEKIIGLPILISARHRVVLDQGLCRRYGIPENGPVQAIIGSETISIFPVGAQIPAAEQKQVTIGRFNLPTRWAKQNHAEIGRYAFLSATEQGLQIRVIPSTPQQCRQSRVLGIPIKIFKGNLIYIPKTFWKHFAIQPNHGQVIREETDNRLIFRKYRPEQFPDVKKVLLVYRSSIHVQLEWMSKNELNVGDTVWLFGTSDGPMVSTRPAYENFDCR
ncbi:hypothetical protein CAFE_08200 [Caprobacter fermentans]|uniref:Uncharacterized protein n=1 Tax=Caproicibacter fermentans TaxID=2576756 RepID=A0A6N8HXR5_9FIRM|nr:hypothetical protein [Caproicibacter fermentans]MVB10143.1 hypothetical protein [Caproicibacter fermentans]